MGGARPQSDRCIECGGLYRKGQHAHWCKFYHAPRDPAPGVGFTPLTSTPPAAKPVPIYGTGGMTPNALDITGPERVVLPGKLPCTAFKGGQWVVETWRR